MTERGHRAFAAIGLGGQLIEVVPDLDLVVVMTSAPAAAQDLRAAADAHRMVADVIIPAIRD